MTAVPVVHVGAAPVTTYKFEPEAQATAATQSYKLFPSVYVHAPAVPAVNEV